MKKIVLIMLSMVLTFSLFSCNKVVKPTDDIPPVQQDTPLVEVINALSKDEFTSSTIVGKSYGLDDATNVGVDKDKFDNEIKYPIPADSEFASDAIFTVEKEDGIDGITLALTNAKKVNESGKKVKIKLDSGIIEIDSTKVFGTHAIMPNGFDGLYIQGNNTTIIMKSNGKTAWKGCISIENCKNVYVQGITIDYDRAPSFTAIVDTVDTPNKKIKLTVPDEFKERFIGVNAITIISYVEFDKFTNAPRENGNFLYNSDIRTAIFVEDMLEITFNNSITTPPKGTLVALSLTMRTTNAFQINKSENVYLETIKLYASPSMGFVGLQSKNLYMNRTNVMLNPNSQRKMSSSADGMHYIRVQGDLKITNSLIENSHDDAINVKCGYYMKITSVDVINGIIMLSLKQPDTVLPPVGAELEFYDTDLNYLSKAKVVESSKQGAQYQVKVQGDYENITKGMLAMESTCSPKFTFSNNIIRNKRNRGGLIQVRGGELSNNTFEGIVHGCLNIHSETISGAYESMMPNNIIVKNNKFMNNFAQSEINIFTLTNGANGIADPGTIKNITIKNNFFTKLNGAAMSIGSASDIIVENNLFRNTAKKYNSETYNSAVVIDNSKDITIKNNYNSNDLGDADFAGIRTMRATDPKTIKLENNVNMEYPKSTEMTSSPIKKGGEFVIDGDLADWEAQGTNIPIVGESLANGVQFKDYKNEFNVRMLKMAWTDSGIYLATDIFDNLTDFKTAANFWNADCAEILMTDMFMDNADYSLLKKNSSVTIAQIGLGSWGAAIYPGRTSQKVIDSYQSSWESKFVKTSDGWKFELYMPFSSLSTIKESIDKGNPIGMAIVLADGDRASINRTRLQVSNCNHFVEENKVKTDRAPRYSFIN